MKTLRDYKKHPNWKKIRRLAAKIEVVSNAGKGQHLLGDYNRDFMSDANTRVTGRNPSLEALQNAEHILWLAEKKK